MKQNFTAIAVIIDASGSMRELTKDTIGSFNSFLNEQKALPGEAAFSLCTFNNNYHLVHDFVSLHNVPELNSDTYRATGGTALLDAMGTTIDAMGAKLAAMPEEERPSKVIVLVITDGEENSSQRFDYVAIKNKVTHQREVYSWEFVFIGANIDAISAGTNLGISAQNSVAYTASAAGTEQLFRSVSSNMGAYRISEGPSQLEFFGQTGETPTTNLQGQNVPAQSQASLSPALNVPMGSVTQSVANTFNPGHSLPNKQ